MIRVPEHTRREVKFVDHAVHYDRLLQWVRSHPAGFGRPFPDRWINNVYFDSHDLETFGENLLGASARSKVRYRWYGEHPAPGPGILEVKRKRNSFGWKLHYTVPESPYREGATWSEVRRRLLELLPPEGRIWLLEHPEPALLNRYLRRYFLSGDGKVRVTLDTHQGVWDQRAGSRVNLSRRAPFPDFLTVEVKCERQDWETASRYIQGIPLRVSRYSKYVTGLETSQGR